MLNAAQGFTYNKFQKPNDWPKIEDTFDYKYDNGKLIGGNENLFLSGPVTYEVVGNPTIVDGIYTGAKWFTDYVRTSDRFKDEGQDFEINIKIKSPDALTNNTYTGIWCCGTGGYAPIINFQQKKIRFCAVRAYESTPSNPMRSLYTPDLLSGTWYTINVSRINGTYYLKYKDEHSDWILSDSETTDYRFYGATNEGQYMFFGLHQAYSSNSSSGYTGSIDLNHTYIKVNGKLWFYGKNYTTSNMVPVPKGLEYNNTSAPSNGWVYTNSDLVKGPVDYTVVGSPTIVDGVASGFSKSDYFEVPLSFASTSNFEIVVRAKLSTSGAGSYVFCVGNGQGIYTSFNNTTISFVNRNSQANEGVSISGTFEPDTYYYLKFSRQNNVLSVGYSLTNNNFIEESREITFLSNLQWGWRIAFAICPYQWTNAFAGSIDLNETYIKVNGQPWFGNVSRFQEFIPAPQEAQIGKDDTHNLAVETPIVNGELLSPKLVGPVSYTVVGSPTIVDGVMTYSNVSNYVRTRQNFLRSYNDYEIVCKCAKRLSTEEIVYCMSTGNNGNLQARLLSNAFRFIPYTFSDYIQISGTFATNVWYWFKVRRTGNTIYASYSTDGVSWSNEVSKTFTQLTTASNWIAFGTRVVSDSDWNGTSIDLNETYIKVNGKLWFGKEDWTPSTHTDNAIYLLGSHSTDYSNYNTQGINPTIETESDESGTYNVWIDNQKIYKEQSNPLDINWSNLALTTGYNITTPSTLKAHVIKVEPNNGNITRFSTDTNYKVENGLLTWASPKLYLEGPTQYTVVGTPTIVDGVASGFSSSNYLRLNGVIDFTQSFELFTKLVPDIQNAWNPFIRFKSYYTCTATKNGCAFIANSSAIARVSGFELNSYYCKFSWNVDTSTVTLAVSPDKITWYENSGTFTPGSGYSNLIIGTNISEGSFNGSIDLNNTYIKVNNELWFGKIYTSETDVPVPANFTYGNTTTSSNGTVNLTTQEFSADTLATYGKDS